MPDLMQFSRLAPSAAVAALSGSSSATVNNVGDLSDLRVSNPGLYRRFGPIRRLRPRCPAGGAHVYEGSGLYTLVLSGPSARGQPNWHRCRRCGGLFYAGQPASPMPGQLNTCPSGGLHDGTDSPEYVLRFNVPKTSLPFWYQDGWFWCYKCGGLHHGEVNGRCPGGVTHDCIGSGNYAIALGQPEAQAQDERYWRCCSKCLGLSYDGDQAGLPRAELALPVVGTETPGEADLYEAAEGPSRFYVPVYALARRVVSGSDQYDIRMEPGDAGQWMLHATFDKARPPGIAVDPAITELPHTVQFQFAYTLAKSDGGVTPITLDFATVTTSADGSTVARLSFGSPAERDQAYGSLTTRGSGCRITATRTVRVATPVPDYPGNVRPITRGISGSVQPEPLYINPVLNPLLGASPVAPVPGSGIAGLVVRRLAFGTRFYKYWEDATRPGRFFYLPDSFRLMRRDRPAPHTPMMSVHIVAGASADADPQVVFEFAASPWVDAGRLSDARLQIGRGLAPSQAAGTGSSMPSDADLRARVSMEPMPVAKASFWLALPGAAGGGLVERPAAQLDVGSALVDAETVSMTDFQSVYDALMGGGVAIMNGEVRADFDGATEIIPFVARFDQMNGDLVQSAIVPGDAPGVFKVTLTNAIESPVTVPTLNAALLVSGLEMRAATMVGLATPQVLAPGEALSFTLRLPDGATAPPAGATLEPLLDVTALRATPDPAKIWAVVLNADSATAASRTIKVKLFPGMFEAADNRPDNRALAVLVTFESGPTLELTPEAPAAEARLRTGVTDLILRTASASGYRYKSQIVRRAGRVSDTDWRTDTTDLLIPLLPVG